MTRYLITSPKEEQLFFTYAKRSKVLGLDTETGGLSFNVDPLWSIQVSDGENSALYDCSKGQYYPFLAQLLKNSSLKIAHNASFDLKFLWKAGYEVNNIYCSMVAEQVLYPGMYMNFGLKDSLERLLGSKIDKTARKDFWQKYKQRPTAINPLGLLNESYFGLSKEWTPDLVDYALTDVEHLPALHSKQLAWAIQTELLRTLNLEQLLVPEIARAEYRGIKLNLAALDRFEQSMLQTANLYEAEVRSVIEPNYEKEYLQKYEEYKGQYLVWDLQYKKLLEETNKRIGAKLAPGMKELRDEFRATKPKKVEPYTGLNLDSTDQMKLAFAASGIPLANLQKETLEELREEHNGIDLYLTWGKYSKLAEFAKIKEKAIDGVIYCSLNQAGTETGRMSSSSPNLQNQPARSKEGKQLRACFEARPGNKFIIADYAAIELIIIGVLSGDENILRAINEDKDLHVWTMSLLMRTDYDALMAVRTGTSTQEQQELVDASILQFKKDLPLSAIDKLLGKEYIGSFRDYCKTLSYGMAYGLSEYGLSRKFKCASTAAREFIRLFFDRYSKIKEFLDREGNLGFTRGYSTNINGRRRYFGVLKQPRFRDYGSYPVFKEATRAFYSKKRRIERQAANFSIQSTSADITKLSILKCAKRLRGQGIPIEYGLILTIHDENVLEVPIEYADFAAQALQEAMQEAAIQILGDGAKIVVDAKIHDHWEK